MASAKSVVVVILVIVVSSSSSSSKAVAVVAAGGKCSGSSRRSGGSRGGCSSGGGGCVIQGLGSHTHLLIHTLWIEVWIVCGFGCKPYVSGRSHIYIYIYLSFPRILGTKS